MKILKKSATFKAVRYNTGKVDNDRGELLLVQNFGALQGLENLRPQDYINYLEAVSARSTRIKYPQFHVAISTKGRAHSKGDLSDIAQKWMEGMGYGNQPYLLILHRDTANNHVHLVSTRVGRDGKKISDKYEKLRAYRVLNQIIGKNERQATSVDLQKALGYSFSTRAQFMMILEGQGYALALKDGVYAISKYGRELASIDVAKVDERIAAREKDKGRVAQVRAIIEKYRSKYDSTPYTTDAGYTSTLSSFLHEKFGLQAVFHGKNGKPPYGYTLIDHAAKAVYKGGEVMPLAEFIAHQAATDGRQQPHSDPAESLAWSQTKPPVDRPRETDPAVDTTDPVDHASGLGMFIPDFDISISDDIDDEATLGHNRRRKKKARTNTR